MHLQDSGNAGPDPAAARPKRETAPILFVPQIFEPALCQRLIDCHDADGGQRSGFTRIQNGIAVPAYDDSYKIRSDYAVADPALRDLLAERLRTRLLPEIERIFGYRATRTERWLVTRYDGAEGGFIRAHRDNAHASVAHRVLSCTINLNAEDYEGGELRFPEISLQAHRPLTGGAFIFDSSLLHEVIPVRHGQRYAFVTFFYDEKRVEQRRQQPSGVHFPEDMTGWTSFAPVSERTGESRAS